MRHAITYLPLWLVGLLVLGGIIGTSVGGLILTRRWMRRFKELPNDLAGFVYAVVGVCYAVLLGMRSPAGKSLITEGWERFFPRKHH